MSARDAPSTYRTNTGGVIRPETNDPALLALLRDNSAVEPEELPPPPANRDVASRQREVSEDRSSPEAVDDKKVDGGRKSADSSGVKEDQPGSNPADDNSDQDDQTPSRSNKHQDPNTQPAPAARSISQTIIRDDTSGERRGTNPSISATPVSHFVPSETDSASSELARLVGTPSRKSFVLSEPISEADTNKEEESEQEEEEGSRQDSVNEDNSGEEEEEEETTPVSSPVNNPQGGATSDSKSNQKLKSNNPTNSSSSHPPPSTNPTTLQPDYSTSVLSPDLTNPSHQRFVTPYNSRRLKDNPVGRSSTTSFAVEGDDEGRRRGLNVPKDQSWSVNQAARLKAGAGDSNSNNAESRLHQGDTSPPDNVDSRTPTPGDLNLVDSLDVNDTTPRHVSQTDDPQSDENTTRRSSTPPPLESNTNPASFPHGQDQPSTLDEDSNPWDAGSRPSSRVPQSGRQLTGVTPEPVRSRSSPVSSARKTPASILKKRKDKSPPSGGNSALHRVYVDSPTFTREEEEEYRFVSSRVENHDDENPPTDHPTYRGMDEQAVRAMESSAASRSNSRPVKQVRYQDDEERYEDREEGSQEPYRPVPKQRQFVLKAKSGSAEVSRTPNPVKSLVLPSGPSYDPADEEDLVRETTYQNELRDRVTSIQRSAEGTVIPPLPLNMESEDFHDSLDFPEDVELDSERHQYHPQDSLDVYDQRRLNQAMQNTSWGDPPTPPPNMIPPGQRGPFPPQRFAHPGYSDAQRDYQGQGYHDPQRGYQGQGQGYDPQRGYQGQGQSYDPQRGYQGQDQGYDPQRGYQVQGQRQDYANYQGQNSQREGYPEYQDYRDPRQRFANPQQQDFVDPRQGFGNPQQQDFRDPRQGFADSHRQGFGDPRQGFGDPRQRLADQSQGFGDPRRQAYVDPGRHSYEDPQQGYRPQQGYDGPPRQRFEPPNRYADPQRYPESHGPTQGYPENFTDPRRQGYNEQELSQGRGFVDLQREPQPPRQRDSRHAYASDPQMLGYGDFPSHDQQRNSYENPAYIQPEELTPRVGKGGHNWDPSQADRALPRNGASYDQHPELSQHGGYYAQETQPPHAANPNLPPPRQAFAPYASRHNPPPPALPNYGVRPEPVQKSPEPKYVEYDSQLEVQDGGTVFNRYEAEDGSEKSTPRSKNTLPNSDRSKIILPHTDKDHINNNKTSYGRPAKHSYRKLHEIKKEEEEKLTQIFIQPKVKGKSQKGSRNTSPSRYPAIAENPTEDEGPGAEQLWAQRSASLAQTKSSKQKNGKKKPGSNTSMLSRNNSHLPAGNSAANQQQAPPTFLPQPHPSHPPQPSQLSSARTFTLQHPVQGSPTHTSPLQVALQPVTQQLVTEDGQRFSVDVNLRLISPPVGGSVEEGSRPLQGNQRTTGLQYPLDNSAAPYGQHPPYGAPPKDDYPQAPYSADDALSSKHVYGRVNGEGEVGQGDRAGYVSDGDYTSAGYSTNPYKKLPPIPPSSEAPRSAPTQSEGSYMLSYLKEKEKTLQSSKPSYRVYGLRDYKRMQQEVRLGTLGPDLDNDTYKERREKVMRQTEYARSVKTKNSKDLVTRKPPAFPKAKPSDDLLSKRKLAVEYSRSVPKPTVKPPKPTPFNNYELAAKVSPISKTSRVQREPSPPPEPSVDVLDLQKLHERHEQDKRNADMIRQKAQGVSS